MTDRFGQLCYRISRAGLCVLAACVGTGQAQAQVAQARISGLSDIDFGQIGTFSADLTRSQTVCAYSSGLLLQYHVTATGNGPGFLLTGSTGGTLAYEVQWNQAANSTSGTSMTSGVALNGQTAALLSDSTCLLSSSGSLIVILRSAALTAARAGNYSGTLTILLAPN